ncbi:hypothetical protein Pla22_49950 [Rubripirellula amarantea]|uniref:Uncharacterized protein n=1 Tax=Rubripirellula amarantea TaxID=2527999 RepID=A0A5C5WD36_9BACT|nr:hypothetical protein [Rubripirellula amarantea]TWT47995.1 hypothetical protein Pla22_49950 [Rubripirellula amarantea]
MRRYELAANAIIHFPILLIFGIAIATAWPLNLWIVAFIYACGVIDLAYAKLPQIRQGILASFGPSLVPAERRSSYYRAYRRLGFAFGLHCLVLVHYFVVVTP